MTTGVLTVAMWSAVPWLSMSICSSSSWGRLLCAIELGSGAASKTGSSCVAVLPRSGAPVSLVCAGIDTAGAAKLGIPRASCTEGGGIWAVAAVSSIENCAAGRYSSKLSGSPATPENAPLFSPAVIPFAMLCTTI